MKLIINPEDMPRIWACSENHAWMIERSKPFPKKGGKRLYHCQKTNSRKGGIEKYNIWDKSMIGFLVRLEAIADTRIQLIEVIDGVEYDLLQESRSKHDTSVYGQEIDETVSHTASWKMTDEQIEQAVIMYEHMEGSCKSRCAWLGRHFGGVHPLTIRRHVKRFDENLRLAA